MDKSVKGTSEIAQNIWRICPPIIFTVGVIGNIVTIVVLACRSSRHTSTTVYITAMAAADLLVMCNTLPRWWLIYTFDVDVRLYSDFSCKFHWSITYIGGAMSTLTMCAVTIERIISTVQPHKVRLICTKKSAYYISCFIFICILALCSHIFYGFKIVQFDTIPQNVTDVHHEIDSSRECNTSDKVNGSETLCSINTRNFDEDSIPANNVTSHLNKCGWFLNQEYEYFYTNIHHNIIFFLIIVFPQCVLLIGGIVILRQIALSKTIFKQSIQGMASINKLESQVTRTMILVNVVFFVCDTPVQVFLLGRDAWIDTENGMTPTQEVVWAVCNMLFYINKAINFIIYFLSGARFRNDVLDVLRCSCTKPRTQMNNFSSNNLATLELSSNVSNIIEHYVHPKGTNCRDIP